MRLHVRFCEEYDPEISGVYKDGEDVFKGAEPGESYKFYDDCKLYRFCFTFGQYIITAFDNGTYTEVKFKEICTEMRALMTPEQP